MSTPDPVSIVAHPDLDFPDSITDFHRGAVFAWRAAVEEFEDRARDLDRAHAAPYWDVVTWLENKVESFRAAAERASSEEVDCG